MNTIWEEELQDKGCKVWSYDFLGSKKKKRFF